MNEQSDGSRAFPPTEDLTLHAIGVLLAEKPSNYFEGFHISSLKEVQSNAFHLFSTPSSCEAMYLQVQGSLT